MLTYYISMLPDAQEAGSDNRNIVDDGKSQKLTRDDIETLKEQGLKGQVQPENIHTGVINQTKIFWWGGGASIDGARSTLQEIIQQLIDNSSTFRDKTEFSQQKYIKKKKKKYVVLCNSSTVSMSVTQYHIYILKGLQRPLL